MPNMPVRRNRENRLARRENDHMKKILQPLFSLNMKARIYILVAVALQKNKKQIENRTEK